MITTALDEKLGSKVKQLLDERGLQYKPFAVKIGLDDSLFRRLLRGKSRWNTTYLEKVSLGLGQNIEINFDKQKKSNIIPLKCQMLDDPHFRFIHNDILTIWKSGNLQWKMLVTQAINMCLRPEQSMKPPGNKALEQ